MWPAVDRWTKSRLRSSPRLFRGARWIRRRIRALQARVLPQDFWDLAVGEVEAGQMGGWLDSDFIEKEYIRPQISGDRRLNYLQHFQSRHLGKGPAERALSLGCGGGNLERAMLAMNMAMKIDAFDASQASIRLAKQLADGSAMGGRIHYAVADINRIQLPEAAYDFVIIKMALHHFEALEHVYSQIERALRPGGLLVFNEFIGPTRFQWTDLQLRWINELLACLPPAQRTLPVFTRPTLAEMIAEDPTESIRSAEILPVLDSYFDIVEWKPYGGTLINLLLTETLPTFDLEKEEHVSILRLLFSLEKSLIESGTLPSDFAYVVARPKAE